MSITKNGNNLTNYQMAGLRCRYGKLFVSNGFGYLIIVVITGRGIGSFIAFVAYAYRSFLIDVLL